MRIQSRTFSAGVPASVECEIVGSRPVPEVTWFVCDHYTKSYIKEIPPQSRSFAINKHLNVFVFRF